MRRPYLVVVLFGDLIALCVGFAVAARVVFGTWAPWTAPLHGEDSIWSLLGLMVGGLLFGSYLSVRMAHFAAQRPQYGRAIVIAMLALAFTMSGVVVTRGYWSRPFLAWATVVWLVGSLSLRLAMRRLKWVERVLIVSDERGLIADLASSSHLEVVGVLDPAGEVLPVEGKVTLALDLSCTLSDETAQFVTAWSLAGRPVRSLADVYEEHLGRIPIVHIEHGWELTAPLGHNAYEPVKRLIDVVSVVATMPLWMLLGIGVWIAVRVESPGKAIYRQSRVGRYGRPFTLYKFRTMIENAEEDGPRFAQPDDPRFTRVGRLLRRFRLDELPQLWNVLRGDLSVIGPRPERPHFVREFESTIPLFAYRTLIRPGVTGWAQVNYGYADGVADAVEKLSFDLYYVKHMSVWLDLQILARSAGTVVSGFGAR